MSHNFQICPIDFALHGDSDPYDIFAFKITDIYMCVCVDWLSLLSHSAKSRVVGVIITAIKYIWLSLLTLLLDEFKLWRNYTCRTHW